MWLERISGLIHFLGVDNELGLVFAFISGWLGRQDWFLDSLDTLFKDAFARIALALGVTFCIFGGLLRSEVFHERLAEFSIEGNH